jgi:replication factor A1
MAMFVPNENHFTKLNDIDSDKASYNVRVKILRLWEVSDFNRANSPFSIEMVLMDSEGGRIHATIKKTLIYKFKDSLVEGNVYGFDNVGVSTNGGAYRSTHHRYKLNFQFSSMVQKLSNVDIKGSGFNFVPISEVVGGSYDTDYLVGKNLFI